MFHLDVRRLQFNYLRRGQIMRGEAERTPSYDYCESHRNKLGICLPVEKHIIILLFVIAFNHFGLYEYDGHVFNAQCSYE